MSELAVFGRGDSKRVGFWRFAAGKRGEWFGFSINYIMGKFNN
jgi:hypothetical protein